MHKYLIVIAVVAISISGLTFWLGDRDRVDHAGTAADAPAPLQKVSEKSLEGITLMPVAAEAARIGSDETEIREDVEIVGGVLEFYRRLYDQNPVGLNHEIVRSLSGRNEKGAAFLAPDHPAINENGELTDRWGTPFFFHQLSAKEMEVISAGPDRQLWTADDVKSG